MRNIHEVIRLVRLVDDPNVSRDVKVEQIKLVRDNGDITDEEAVEFALEI